ncbi:hypothetical protein FQN49_006418 [Arthroderma sp. PD_2]|nr:hypothetical protein FQN49_006418 [Arthroderma sp. PD_2]
MIRLAMDQNIIDCAKHGGASALCCNPSLYHDKEVEGEPDPELTYFREVLEVFAANSTCPVENPFEIKPFFQSTPPHIPGNSLSDQGLEYMAIKVSALLAAEVLTKFQMEMVKIWDDVIVKGMRFGSLTIDRLRKFVRGWKDWNLEGSKSATLRVLCSADSFNNRLSDDPPCDCAYKICANIPDFCPGEDDELVGGSHSPINHTGGTVVVSDKATLARRSHGVEGLKKRGSRINRKYIVTCDDGQTMRFDLWSDAYPSASAHDPNSDIYDKAIDFVDLDKCGNPNLGYTRIPTGRDYATEHIIELQTITSFFALGSKGKLTSKKSARFEPLNDCLFYPLLKQKVLKDRPATFLGGSASPYPRERIMHAFGSDVNRANFWLLYQDINAMKARLWGGIAPVETSNMLEYANNLDEPEIALVHIKTAISVFNYLNHPEVHDSMVTINRHIRQELALAETGTSRFLGLVDAWDEFLLDILDNMVEKATLFVDEWLRYMLLKWSTVVVDTAARRCKRKEVFNAISELRRSRSQIYINKSSL